MVVSLPTQIMYTQNHFENMCAQYLTKAWQDNAALDAARNGKHNFLKILLGCQFDTPDDYGDKIITPHYLSLRILQEKEILIKSLLKSLGKYPFDFNSFSYLLEQWKNDASVSYREQLRIKGNIFDVDTSRSVDVKTNISAQNHYLDQFIHNLESNCSTIINKLKDPKANDEDRKNFLICQNEMNKIAVNQLADEYSKMGSHYIQLKIKQIEYYEHLFNTINEYMQYLPHPIVQLFSKNQNKQALQQILIPHIAKFKVNVNLEDENSDTLLHLTIRSNHISSYVYLLSEYKDTLNIHKKNALNETPISLYLKLHTETITQTSFTSDISHCP